MNDGGKGARRSYTLLTSVPTPLSLPRMKELQEWLWYLSDLLDKEAMTERVHCIDAVCHWDSWVFQGQYSVFSHKRPFHF